MEETLGADGYGFLEQHDALIGLVADELQGGEAAGRRHVEMLPAARGHDKAFCCGHVGVLPCGGMRIYVGTMNINGHEHARPGSICPRTIRRARPRQRALLQRRVRVFSIACQLTDRTSTAPAVKGEPTPSVGSPPRPRG